VGNANADEYLRNMRRFAQTYPEFQKRQQGVAFLPWRNNLTLMSKLKDENERQWYIDQNLENGWNNTVLTHQIEMKLYQRQVTSYLSLYKYSSSPQVFTSRLHLHQQIHVD
jgi:predicted nuclease of restriction endonuclease-like (RecB) superfamily